MSERVFTGNDFTAVPAQRPEPAEEVRMALGLQPKLRVNAPGDHWEREADRIADAVVAERPVPLQSPLPVTPTLQRQEEEEEEEELLQPKAASLQRQPEEEEEEEMLQPKAERIQRQPEEEEEELQTKAGPLQRQPVEEEEELQTKAGPLQRQPEEEEEEEEMLQPKAGGAAHALPAPGAGFAAALASESQSGQQLDHATRAEFEPRFGRDLSTVRLHTGAGAAQLSRQINARAFTHRNHIFFANGQLDTQSREGRRLLAHEITHTLQQGSGAGEFARKPIQRENGPGTPAAAPAPGAAPGPAAAPAAPTRPTSVTFNFDPTIAIPQTPGGLTGMTASTNGTSVTWSIAAHTAASVAAGTTIDPSTGAIALDAGQVGGKLRVTATNSAGFAFSDFRVASTPTGIDATSVLSALSGTSSPYGAAFQHTFTSANGSATVLEQLRIGERFPTAPTPTAATHVFVPPAWPFHPPNFTLSTGTLADNAAGAFVLDANGEFNAPPAGSTFVRGDNVSVPHASINAGDHVQSHTTPTPTNGLPVTFSLDQQLHFFNPRAASGSRWTHFTTTNHSRTLRRSGTDLEVVTTVNGEEHVDDYQGPPAFTNLTASPVNTPKSRGAPPGGGAAPAARTVALSVDQIGNLPTGQSVRWRFIGRDLGCSITRDPSDPTRAELTIGTTAGTVTIEVSANTGGNADRVQVRIL
jgi:hypothetical protein